tara:strand:- start:60 stop:218 length:159 start_codon:yes stop_codon:yes gene_type:complete
MNNESKDTQNAVDRGMFQNANNGIPVGDGGFISSILSLVFFVLGLRFLFSLL